MRARSADQLSEPVLSIEGLATSFETDQGVLPAVNDVSFAVMPGETLGVVGESGSGKTITAMSVLGLLPPNGRVVSGRAWFQNQDLLALSDRKLRAIRGSEIGIVFQDPMSALNPIMTVGAQVAENLRDDARKSNKQRFKRVVELLSEVGIPNPRERARSYPHQLSGGMRQRVMVALAMANRPRLLIADEPTTALDVTIQSEILDLIRKVQIDTAAALILITHDLGVIAEMAQRVVVMYAGRVVESGSVDDIFHRPRHPYTRGLLSSLPRFYERTEELIAIPGQPPNPRLLPEGCSFRPRCDLSNGRFECLTTPELLTVGARHMSACHFAAELREEIAI